MIEMGTALLIDIGSTFTKASLVDLARAELLARAQYPTTIAAGVNIGLSKVLEQLPGWEKARYKLACSSAAGGLKIIAIGFVPRMTAEAAKRAALGAGSKVLQTYSYELNAEDLAGILEKNPDLILLTGGTDGGNRENLLRNASKLAELPLQQPIIVAGNKTASAEAEDILLRAGKEVYLTENVMPELDKLNIEPAREMIRKIFLEKIINAKGLDVVNKYIDGIIMPTPSAVLKAAALLADGFAAETGLGELMVVDPGGATTDIYSIAAGKVKKNVFYQGLEEPYQKRTVEGDLGIRYSLSSLLEAIGEELLEEKLKELEIGKEEFQALMLNLSQKTETLTAGWEKELERFLAFQAVRIAAGRHVGRLRTIYTPLGTGFIQEGKDLTTVKYLIGTGGVIVYNQDPGFIISGALYNNQNDPELLAPGQAEILVDQEYILAAAGLLAEVEPETALRLMKNTIRKI